MARKKDLGKPSVLSQEYVVDSDSDGLGEAGASAQKTTSISEWERPMKRKQKKAQTASNIGTKSTSGRRNDVKETSSPISHESSSEGERSSQREVEKTQKRQKTMPPTPNSTVVAIPATSFRPPSGFGELTPDASDFSAEALEKFSGDLAGKQVWHITAPVSVPLASIREFDLEGLRNGHPILSHNQRQYGFSTSTTDSEGLLLPEGRSSTYKRLKTCKLQSYHLREILNHSNAGGPNDKQGREAVNFFAKEVPLSKPAPKQPETLRMRYTPFGTDRPPSTSTSTHRDPTVAENHFQVSTPLSSPPHESTAPPKSTPRKKKKDKMKKERNSARSGPNDEDGLENDPMEVDGSPASATTVQRPASQTEPSLVETATLTGDVDGDKLVSEKKKRKKKIREEGSS